MGMTIAIRDFEMPPSCYNCNFCLRRRTTDYGYFGMCDLTNEVGINLYEHSRSEDCPLVEAIPKVGYENRLKADMVAILTDIQLDVEGQKFDTHIDKDVWNDAIRVCSELIQQRIDKLRGEV